MVCNSGVCVCVHGATDSFRGRIRTMAHTQATHRHFWQRELCRSPLATMGLGCSRRPTPTPKIENPCHTKWVENGSCGTTLTKSNYINFRKFFNFKNKLFSTRKKPIKDGTMLVSRRLSISNCEVCADRCRSGQSKGGREGKWGREREFQIKFQINDIIQIA